MKIYCLYDRVGSVHGEQTGLHLLRSDDVAKRAFKSALRNKQLPPTIIDYPGDFDLVRIGEFDQKSGTIAGEPEIVINLKNLLEAPGNE